MTEPNAFVPLPEIALRDGTPCSTRFDDVYFSRAGGAAETEHVFLAGNGLPARWHGRTSFTVAELGFGTGLNFLVTWQKFLATAAPGQHLHYVAVEQFPWEAEALRAAYVQRPELAGLLEQLLAALPLRLPGLHRICFEGVTLTLCYGEVAEMLAQLDVPVDAWFLDGFSPAKNPAMWTREVLGEVRRLSAGDATVATFTAAGAVKRGLEAQGFVMQKRPGFGHKREMLVGKRESEASIQNVGKKEILILGAGIAGATLAHTLATRGWQVMVLERGAIASGASGNAAAVLFPQLTKRWTASAAWYFAAYGFMLRQLPRWPAFTYAQPGMLRLPRHAAEEVQLQGVNETLGLDPAIVHWVARDVAEKIAGIELMGGAAFFPHGTWVDPAALCHALLRHPNITCVPHTEAKSLRREAGQWCVETVGGGAYAAPHCCVAAAHETTALLTNYGMRLNAVAGQVSMVAAADVRAPLRSILCHKGYVIPRAESYLLGATYNHDVTDGVVTDANHATNIAEVNSFLPSWVMGAAVGGRMSMRATTPDRMPYVGALAEGLYVSTGHGSRGMLSAPLAAEMIASELCAEQAPVARILRAAVSPLRFTKA